MEDIEKRHGQAFQDFFDEQDDEKRARKFEKFKDATERGKQNFDF